VHFGVKDFDSVDVHALGVGDAVLGRLVAALHVNLSLLELHAVVAEVQLVHVVASHSLPPIDVVEFVRVLRDLVREVRPRVRLLLDYVVVDDAGLDLLARHFLTQTVEEVELRGRQPHVLQVQTLVERNQVLRARRSAGTRLLLETRFEIRGRF